MAGEDFVQVQLSPAGAKRAKGGDLRITLGRRSFVFKAGVVQRIEKGYEWGALLSGERYKGESMFMIAPPQQPQPQPVPAPQPIPQPQQPAAVDEKKG